MTATVAWLIAGCSTTAFIVLWFCMVRRELRIKQSMLESAEIQLAIVHEQCAEAQDDPDKQGILNRSLDIYRQAIERYNETLRKPWNIVPGFLMGYRLKKDE